MKRKREILALTPWVLSIQTLNRTHLQPEAGRLQPPLMRQRGVFETSPCEYFHDISSISKSIDNRTLLYICVFIYYSRTDRHTLIMNNVSTSFPESPGDELFFLGGGRGQGVFLFFLSKTVAMLIKLVLLSKTCNRTFFVTWLISH